MTAEVPVEVEFPCPGVLNNERPQRNEKNACLLCRHNTSSFGGYGRSITNLVATVTGQEVTFQVTAQGEEKELFTPVAYFTSRDPTFLSRLYCKRPDIPIEIALRKVQEKQAT